MSGCRAARSPCSQPAHQLRQKQLWESLFSCPWEWWDNRAHKPRQLQPDFKHRTSCTALWLDRLYKSCWVDPCLPALTSGVPPSWQQGIGCVEILDGKELLSGTGKLDQSLAILCRMVQLGNVLPENAYLSLLKVCRKAKALDNVRRIHAHLIQHKWQFSVLLGDHLVDTFVKCDALDDAHNILSDLPIRSTFSCTVLISAYAKCGRGHEALEIHRCMQAEGLEPNEYTFVSLFKACAGTLNLLEAERLYSDVQKRGLDSDVFVGCALVSMYCKCGYIEEAEKVFNSLLQRDTVSCNAMLSAYIEQGEGRKVLLLYRQLEEERVILDEQTYAITLHACKVLVEAEDNVSVQGQLMRWASLDIGRALHFCVRRNGFTANSFICSSLITMYGKGESVIEAEIVFDAFSQHDIVKWNTLLAVYVENGQSGKALQLYRQMHEEGVSSNHQTFVVILTACNDGLLKGQGMSGEIQSLELVQALHTDAQRKGFASNVFVGSTLMSLYGKYGHIEEAENIFTGLCIPDIVSLNAMMAVYVKQDKGERALQFYRQMQEEGVNSSQQLFVLALQACCAGINMEECVDEDNHHFANREGIDIGFLEVVKALHADAWRMGFRSDAFLGSTLVTMYGKYGNIEEAENVFEQLQEHDIVSWTAMLSAYIDSTELEKALQLYRQMQEEGASPDRQTLGIVIQTCGELGEREEVQKTNMTFLEIGQALHSDAWSCGFSSDNYVGSHLVDMYCKFGRIVEAERVLNQLSHCDAPSYITMLSAYVKQGQGEKALLLYRQMQEEGFHTYQPAFVTTLQACGLLIVKEAHDFKGQLNKQLLSDIVSALHADIWRTGLTSDTFVGSTLISLYGKLGSIVEAENVFAGLPRPDIGLWTSMLLVYLNKGLVEKAIMLYREMQEGNVTLDDIIVLCILQACRETGSIDICRHLHFASIFAGHECNPPLASAFILAYGGCASMVEGQTVLDSFPRADVAAWTTCISGHAQEGNTVVSLQMFQEMQLAGLKVDEVSLLSLLSACSHAGLVSEGMEFFACLSREYGIILNSRHYAVMVDLFGRAGDLRRMQNVLLRMPVKPDLGVWLCALGACCTHGSVELGERAFSHALSIEPEDSTAYVLMSNLYVDASLQELVVKVEKLSQDVVAL